jgi:uncharacterized membrane protein
MAQRSPGGAGTVARWLQATRIVMLSPLGITFMSALCLLAADVRRYAQVEPGYGFLRWNLFLALVPLVLAYGLVWAARRELTWPALPALALAWIIFLPNAPYLVTDLVHLDEGASWPNVAVLMLFAITGLLIGVKCVQLVQRTVERAWGVAAGWRLVHVTAVLTAFGIYLGRVKRWNSWTVVEDPHAFVHALRAVPSEPGRVLLAAAGTVVFAICFSIAYRVLAGPSPGPPGLRATAVQRGSRG